VAYTGQSLKRFEDPRLLTGQGAFLDDLTFPDMLYAAVLRSPHAHASIRAIETAAARHAPGVVAVITAEDLEGVVEPLPTRRETEAQELRPPVHPILARGKVCYTGQPVAVVVAQERSLVRDALALIQVDYVTNGVSLLQTIQHS
jgi:aerobic carbon-monoxide dehydrogenase large subunit